MAEPKNRRLVTEKRGFRVKPIKHPRYSYVVYRIADGRRVEQAYFQSERRQIKLEPFVKEFLKAKEEGKTGKKRRNAKPRYLGTLRYRLELLRGYLPEYGLGDLEPEHLTDFLESRPMSGRTWNNYRRDFHVAFAWAVDQKYLLTNPAASVPEAQEDPINAQVLSLEEFLRLIKAA